MTYDQFVQSCIPDCHCCAECGGFGIPCDGVLAGGMCDQMCQCSDDDDERDDYDDQGDW